MRLPICGFLAVMSLPASAALIQVNSLLDNEADDGNCTLREAIIAANSGTASGAMSGECAAGDTGGILDEVVFTPAAAGTLTLSSALPNVNDPTFIKGRGMTTTIIDADAISANASGLRLIGAATLEDLSIINAPGDGAVDASSVLTVRRCRFVDNTSEEGGAIRTSNDLTVEESVFEGNIAAMFGGGAIKVNNSDKVVVIRDSVFSNNTAIDDDGGALAVSGSGHSTVITGSSFIGNAAEDGGAILTGGASLRVTNSTFFGNTADLRGGAVFTGVQSSTFANVTIVGNTAEFSDGGFGDGGGILNNNASAPPTVRDSIIAMNMDLGGENPECSGNFSSGGYNLIGQSSTDCSAFADGVMGDQVGTSMTPLDPMLNEPDDNGGPTPTMEMSFASPGIAAGDPTGCLGADGMVLMIDQRGEPRPSPMGDPCDIGAFEQEAIQFTTLTLDFQGTGMGSVASTDGQVGCSDDCQVSVIEDSQLELVPTAQPGSTFLTWGTDCSGDMSCMLDMSRDKDVSVEFATVAMPVEVDVNLTGTGQGSVASVPAGIQCPGSCSAGFMAGDDVTLTATPGGGQTFVGWSGACSGTGACELINLQSDVSVSAEFEDAPEVLFVDGFEAMP